MTVFLGIGVLALLVTVGVLRLGALKKKRAIARRLNMLGDVESWEVAGGWSGSALRFGEVLKGLGLAKGPSPAAVAIVAAASLAGMGYAAYIANRSGPLWGLVGGMALASLAWILGAGLLDGAARRRVRIARALPDWLDTVACYLQVGMPFESAVGMAIRARTSLGKDLKDEWFRYLQDTRLGIARNEALLALARRCDCEEMHRVIGAVLAASDDRASLAESMHACALDMQASVLARKRAQEGWRLLAVALMGLGMLLAIGGL